MQVQFHPDQRFLSQSSCRSWGSGLTWFTSDCCGWTVRCYCCCLSLESWMLYSWALVSLCVPGWKNWKGPGNMRPLRRAPSPFDITLLSPLFCFCLYPRHFTRKMEKKNQCKHCNYYYYCSVTGSTSTTCTTAFFHISILSTDLVFDGEWQLLRDYKLKGSGWGVQNICFMAFFALFHGLLCLFRIYGEVLDDEGSRTCVRRSVKREDLKRRTLRLLQRISEDSETTQKHSGLLLCFIIF